MHLKNETFAGFDDGTGKRGNCGQIGSGKSQASPGRQKKAEQDAYHWAIYNTDETMEVIKSSATWYRVKYELRSRKNFSGEVLCKTLGDGDYQFNYIIYREHIKDGSNLSMANEAFEHPGILVVKNGVGMIYLRIKNLTAKSPFSLQNITGKAVGCQYMVNGEFIPAEMNEDVVAFPAAVLNFVNIGDNLNQTLHGSVCLKMKCSVTAAHMPEAVAIFSMLHSTWNLTSDSKKTIILSEASLYRHYEKAAERSKKRRSLKDGTEDSKENCIAFGLRD